MQKSKKQEGLYKRGDSKFWWVSYVNESGKRTRRSTGTVNRKEAEALLSKWKVEVYEEKNWDIPKSVNFEEVMLFFLKETASVKRSHRDDKLHARQWTKSLAGKVMQEPYPNDIRLHIQRRINEGVGPATINRELALLSAAINFYNKEQMGNLPNPTVGRKRKEPENRTRWITYNEAKELIISARVARNASHLADFIILALHTGCRSGEMLGLQWKDIDFNNQLIHLKADQTKTDKRRGVPLNDHALKSLLARKKFHSKHCPESSWVFCNRNGNKIASVKKSFKTACVRADIDDFKIHDMRHTCAAWLVTSGVPMPEVRDLLGHSSITMTEKYAHLAPENVRRAVNTLDQLCHV